jgi:hypothetical protein
MERYSYHEVMTGLSSERTHGAIFVSSPHIPSWGNFSSSSEEVTDIQKYLKLFCFSILSVHINVYN